MGGAWRVHGVPREGGPREGALGEALEEVLGKPWGRSPGEPLRKPLKQGVPREVEMWVVRLHAFFPLPPEDGRVYINMPGRG